MTYEEKLANFAEHIESGGKVETQDWMPDDYRRGVLKFIEMHANSEIMGALPERECLPSAPTLKSKMSLAAKIQDEVGHAQLLYRVAEDLGKSRDAMYEDLIEGQSKFHNVFHYPVAHWGDVAIIGWLIDGAALVTQAALLDSSYAPYTRVLKRICSEEQLHLRHGEDITLELSSGTDAQREMFQEALNRWWLAIIHFFGPEVQRRKGPAPALEGEDAHERRPPSGVPRPLRAEDPRARLHLPRPGPLRVRRPLAHPGRGHRLGPSRRDQAQRRTGDGTQAREAAQRSINDHRWVRETLSESESHAA